MSSFVSVHFPAENSTLTRGNLHELNKGFLNVIKLLLLALEREKYLSCEQFH